MAVRRSTAVPLPPAAPPASSPAAARIARATRRRDTGPELALRSALHRRGLRFRVDRRPFPATLRRPDVVFGPSRLAVFVDGCFWHSCPEHFHPPKANAEWWRVKHASIRARDEDVAREFAAHGWLVVRVWEHEDPDLAAERIAVLVGRRRA